MDCSTTTLVRSCARRPREGFGKLYEREARRVFLWAALHVRPALRSWMPLDDFLQEVWARAYAAFGSFDSDRGRFRPWLLGIARNVLREQLRSLMARRMNRFGVPGGEDVEVIDPATSIASRASHAEDRSRLLAFVDELPELDRKVALWRGLEGLPYKEVARRSGLSPVAAESRWRRVVMRLHDLAV